MSVEHPKDFEPEFIEEVWKYRRKHRPSRFPCNPIGMILLAAGVVLVVRFFPHRDTNPLPLSIQISFFLVGAWLLIDFARRRNRKSRVRLGRRYVKSLARGDALNTPRAVLDALEKDGEKKSRIAELRSGWKRGEFLPTSRWFPKHPCALTLRSRLLLQFDGFLQRWDFALDSIYGDRDPVEPVEGVIPDTIPFDEGEYADFGAPLPAGTARHRGMPDMGFVFIYTATRSREAVAGRRVTVSLDLRGLDREGISAGVQAWQQKQMRCLEEGNPLPGEMSRERASIDEEVFEFLFWPLGNAADAAAKADLIPAVLAGIDRPRLSFSVDGEETGFPAEFSLPMSVAAVAGLLYTFYECPWDWKPRVIEKDFRLSDGSLHSLRLSFDPEKELQLERIDKPFPATAEG